MKILKIFGLVVGIHVFALILIFANPGCSTATKPAPVPSDTMAPPSAPATVTAPNTSASGVYTSAPDAAPVSAAPWAGAPAASSTAPAPVFFDPNAPATATAGSPATTVRFTPTRPGTPVVAPLQAEKVTDVTPATTYIVKPGDSLWSIAKRHKLTVADLTVANGIAANSNLQPGKKLLIPSKAIPGGAATTPATPSARPAPVPVKVSSEGAKHTVRSGETLGIIARNYGVRQSDIAVANGISDPARIQAGMELIIPGVSGTGKGAKNGKAAARTEPKVEEPAAAASTVTPPLVPIIKIDEGPVTPAPKP
jgi:LysM repeat protein